MLALVGASSVAVVFAWSAFSSGPSKRVVRHAAPSAFVPALTAADVGWSLPAPVSRAVVTSAPTGVTILGGLDSKQASASGVFHLDPASGALTQAGSLALATHDGAGALIGDRTFVFGGGEQHTTDAVQALPTGGKATIVAHLPEPRSDLATATIGPTTYLVGGYDGSAATRSILATTDGQQFRVVAQLPVGVRYPAVTALGHTIYIVGGEWASVEQTAVQTLNVQTGKARVLAHLRAGLTQASAFTLGGRIYVAGGRSAGVPSADVLRIDPRSGTASHASTLPSPVADAATALVGDKVYFIGGETSAPVGSVMVLSLTTPASAKVASKPPFQGRMLIADRANDRLLVVDAAKHVLWTYPSATAPAPPGGFYFPDDGFFADHGHAIITNQEENHTLLRIAYPSGSVLWTYGHAKVAGSTPGYLDQPDDAFLLPDQRVVVADAKNCRVLFISPQGQPLSQIGTTKRCVHDPPRSLGYPNGDTPLKNGNILISEINGSWVSEYTPDARLVWTVKLPVAYPSDPQQLGPDLYLVADYTKPGGILEFTREGQIVWTYRPPNGPGMLDHPSLAERLPNGLIGVNDDYRHRVALIDPATSTIVWQYGQTDVPGTGVNQLNTPDGFDLLERGGVTPQHPSTG